MAFTAISSAEIQAGEPTKQELFTKIKDNDDDFDSRITTLENTLSVPYPIVFEVFGPYALKGTPQTQVMFERIPVNMTITNVRLQQVTAGTAGTLEINIEKSTNGGGSWSTIFSTRPSLLYSAGDYALSTNQVLSTTSLSAGNFIRLNITSVQTTGREFKVYFEWENT